MTADQVFEGIGVVEEEHDPSLPPHSLQAEEAVLGSVLKNPKAIRAVADLLEARDFYDPRNRHVWQAALDLSADDKPIDYHLLADQLRRNGTYEASGGLVYLSEINLSTPSAAYIAHYAKIVVRTSLMRRLISQAQGLAEAAYRDKKTPEELIVEMERRLSALNGRAVDDHGAADMNHVVDWYRGRLDEQIERARQHSDPSSAIAGWSTGLREIDRLLLGLKAGDLIYLAARTSVGKSVLAQQFAMNVAKAGGAVYFASLEMSQRKLMDRAITMTTGIPRDQLIIGNLSDAEIARKDAALEALAQLPIRLDTKARTTDKIRKRAERWADEIGKPLALVLIDYGQLLEDKASNRSNRYEDLGYASRAMKAIAEDFETAVLCPLQVSRDTLKRKNKMPDLSDMRESGNFEQDADVVLGLDREDYHNPGAVNANAVKHTARVVVLKQRDSGVGRGRGSGCELAWVPKFEFYGDLENGPTPRQSELHDDTVAVAIQADPKEELPWG
jgi:replicative DNA helicase